MDKCDDRLEQPLPRPYSDADAVGLGRCCLCGRDSSPTTASSHSSEQNLLLDCFHGVCRECAAGSGGAAAITCPECGCKTVRADLGEPLTTASAASSPSAPPTPPVPPPLCDNCSQDADDDKRREADHRCSDCKQLLCRPCLRLHNKFASGHATEPLTAVAAAALRLPLCAEHTSASRSLYCAGCGRLRCETCSLVCVGRGHSLASAADAVAAASSAVGGLVASARDAIRDALGELSSQRRQAAEAAATARGGDPAALVSEPRGIAAEPALRLLQRNERLAAVALRQARANAERRLAEERDRRAAQAVRVDAQLDRLANYAERLLLPPVEQDPAAAAVAALDQRRQLVGRMRTLLAEREALASSAKAAADDDDTGQRRQQVVRETTAEEAEAAAAALLGLASLLRGSASSQKRDVEGSKGWLAEAQEEDDEDDEREEEEEEEYGEEDDSNSCSSDGDRGDGSKVSLTATLSSDELGALSSAASATPPASGGGGGGENVDERTLLSCCACGKEPVNPVILSCLHCCCAGCLNNPAVASDLVRGASSSSSTAREAPPSGSDGDERVELQLQRPIKCSLCDSITPAMSVRVSSFSVMRLRQLAGASTSAATVADTAAVVAYCDMCARNGQESVAASHTCPDCNDAPLCAVCLRWHNKFSRSHAPRSIGSQPSASSSVVQPSQRPCERHGIGCRYDTYCFSCGTLRCTNGARGCASVGHDAVAIGSPRAVEQARSSVASLRVELESAIARVDAAAASVANLDGALNCALEFELKSLDDTADAVYRAVKEAHATARVELGAIYSSLKTGALPKVLVAQGSTSRRIGQAAAFCRLLLSSDGEADLLEHHRVVSACLRALGAEAGGLAAACSRFNSSRPQPVVLERCDVDQELVARWIGVPRGDAAKMLDWRDFAPEQLKQQQQRQQHLQQQQDHLQQRPQSQQLHSSDVAPLQQQSLLTPAAADYRAPVRGKREARTVQSSIRRAAANVIQTPRSSSGGYVGEARRSSGLSGDVVLVGLQFEAVPICVVEVTDDARSLLLLCRSECEGGQRGVRSIVVAGPRRGLEEYAVDSGAMLSSWLPMPETGPERDERPIVMAVAVASVAAGSTDVAESVGGDVVGVNGDLLYVGLADTIPTVVVLRRIEMDDGVVWMDEQRIVLRAVPWQLAADGEFLVVAGAQEGDEAQSLPYSPGPYLDLYRRSGPNAMEELFSHETAYDIRCVALIGKVVVTLSNNRMPSASGLDEQAYVFEAFSSRGDMLWRANGFDATDMCALPVAGLLCMVDRNDQRIIALSADDGRYVADVLGGDGGAIRGASRVCFSSRANPFAMAALSTENWVSVYLATVERRV